MPTKTRKIFMAFVGAYLIYTGGTLVHSVLTNRPENTVLFVAAGVIFVLFGLATMIMNIKAYIKAVKQEKAESSDERAEEDYGPYDSDYPDEEE
ncbi:MAG: hypothetical protein HFG41_09545 [Coprococcus sp.]|nr:hypothetical protein [Coprococcus sp.]